MSVRAVGVAIILCAGSAARAQVAVATSISDGDAAQRQIAATIATKAAQRWDMLQPPLTTGDTAKCAPGDSACLRKLAVSKGASHLLVVGVGPLGVRDHVVAVQLFSVGAEKPLFEESAVQNGDAGGTFSGLSDVQEIGRRLVQTPGPPPRKPIASAPAPAPNPETGLLTWIGVSTMIGGTVVGVGGGSIAAVVGSKTGAFGAIDDGLWIGSLLAAGFVATGATLVAIDRL